MRTLRLASFGIRGYVGESLSPNAVIDFVSAFATFLDGGRLLLGRDTRYSSPMFHAAATSALLSAGCEVLDFGICPTAMLQFSVPRYSAQGAVSISGGHNAMGWNAVSLIGADGAYLEPVGGETVLDIFHAGDFEKKDWRHMGAVRAVTDFAALYFEALAQQVNLDAIRRARFTVLVDPVGGAGCAFLQPFAELLGLNLVPFNAEPSGYLAREAEPRPRSAMQMASTIRYLHGHVGFVLDSDAARMSLVSEDGEPASEEYTFAVIADHVLGKRKGTVVTNCCTSRTIDDIARRHEVHLVRTRVGQAYVMSALADEQGILAGEGSGSVSLPAFSRGFDGFLMMALVLESMAESGRKLSEILKALPRYQIVKKSIPLDSRNAYRALVDLEAAWRTEHAGQVDHTDGLRVDWDDGWIHARASRTEPLLRIISESTTRQTAEARAEQAVRLVERHG